MRDKFLTFGSPRIEGDEIDEVVDSLKSGWVGTGPKCKRFEEDFRKYIGAKYAMALNSCTAGLHLCLIALGIGKGDEVITTPLTFASTANVIIHVGAKPVFADVERWTMNIDPKEIEKKITKNTKAIIPVHLAGRPCDMDAIMKIAKRHGIKVVEDAAHAIESVYKGRKIGTIGDLAAFSFYVTKNLVTGEGGMVTTNNKKWADMIQIYALHGLSADAWKRYSDKGYKHYQIIYPGFKYNMMDIQAALGIHQLEKIEKYHKIRESIWNKYNAALKDLPMILPKRPEPNTKHAYHLYTPLLDIKAIGATRDKIQRDLYNENIGTGIHFIALHLHQYYKNAFGFKKGDFPNAEFISERTISLPLSAKLTEEDTDDVIEAVRKVIKKRAG